VGGSAGQASGSGGARAHLGAVGDGSGGSELAGGEVWRWPAVVAAAAWERAAGRGNAGKQASVGASLESRETTRAAGR
jgi:hypothetical protein